MLRPHLRSLTCSSLSSLSRSPIINQNIVSSSSYATASGSHVKAKLGHYIKTGEIISKSPKQYEAKHRKRVARARPFDSNYSMQKALLLLQSNYDGKLANPSTGEMINTRRLRVSDLSPFSEPSKEVFHALLQVSKLTHKPTSKRLMMLLLGIPMNSLTDPFVVTKEILKFLEHDNDTARAEWLARAAALTGSSTVGMNEIMKFLLEKGDTKGGLKNFNNRKKWGIPLNNQSYIILFDGLAKAHSFGGVSDALAAQIVDIFESFMHKTLQINNKTSKKSMEEEEIEDSENRVDEEGVKCSIEHFNACLNLITRNITNDQAAAWSFFNILIPKPKGDDSTKYQQLYPNNQTYTTLLNGVKRFCQKKAEDAIKDRQMHKELKTLKVLEIDAKLISTAEMILKKVIADAIPPVPPTKDESNANPNLLIEYRKLIRKPLIEIDATFVGLFVSCYINGSSGTGTHYKYVSRGMEYLRLWCKEIDPMIQATKVTELSPSEHVRKKIDSKILAALEYAKSHKDISFDFLTDDGSLVDILPETVISSPLEASEINPKVVFPPPLLSNNKSRATFSGKAKPLVDISRTSNTVLKAILDNKQYLKSKGRFGKKISPSLDTRLQLEPINRFIYGLYLESLLRFGLFKEFYFGIWYGLSKWGGMHIDLEKMLESATKKSLGPNRGGLITDIDTDSAKSIDITTSTPPHKEEIIDSLMVENFLYKLSENSPKNLSPSKLCVELISALVNPNVNISYDLLPRYKTIDVIFSILTKELYHVKDSNYNFNRKNNSNINTAKKSLTQQQLNDFSFTLVKLMDSLVIKMEQEQRSKVKKNNDLIVQKQFVESYVRFLLRLQKFVWPSGNDKFTMDTHIRIVRSGIAMYMPTNLIDKRKELIAHSNEGLNPSIEYIVKKLNSSETELSLNEMQLMKWLKILGKKYDGDEIKLRGILLKVKDCCDSILRGEKNIKEVKESIPNLQEEVESKVEGISEKEVVEEED